jgi:hypothetical protein
MKYKRYSIHEEFGMGKKHIHNTECGSVLHDSHLCYLVSQGFHLDDKQEYDAMVKNPKFKCGHCGRVAHDETSLCEPTEL